MDSGSRRGTAPALDALIRMANIPTPEEMGEPALKIAGFQLWLDGPQRQQTNEFYDDWLTVAAHCEVGGSSVWAQGALLEVNDVRRFGTDCEKLLRGEVKKIEMEPAEPNIHVEIEATDKLGHFEVAVDLTPDHMTQEHRFFFEIDQSYLPGIIEQCRKLSERFQIRGV